MKSRTTNMVSLENKAIMCPHCNLNAQHTFLQLSKTMKLNESTAPVMEQIRIEHLIVDHFNNNSAPISILVPLIHNCKDNYYCSQCIMCHDLCIWQYGENDRELLLLYPRQLIHKPLSKNVGENISAPYEQARVIALDSPPAACMLLRLCLERICIKLGVKKQKLMNMIKQVSSDYAFTPMFEKNMELIRSAGNISAHEDLDDEKISSNDVIKLISFTHLLVEYTIEKENNINAMYKKFQK